MSNFPSLKEFAMAKKPVELPPDLQQMLAKDKVTRMLQAAEQDIALEMAGSPPTVDKQLDEGLAKHVMRQMQQQQPAPMQPPGAAPPAAAGGLPAAMAANNQAGPSQGLAGVKSNLPQSYAGGGIIAFNGTNGSSVEDDTSAKAKLRKVLEMLGYPASALNGSLAELRQYAQVAAAMKPPTQDQLRLGEAMTPPTEEQLRLGEAMLPPTEAEAAPPVIPNPRLARQAGAGGTPTPPNPLAAALRAKQSQSTSGPQGGAAPQQAAPAPGGALRGSMEAVMQGQMAANPEEQAEAMQAKKFQMTDPSFQEAIKARQEGLAALKAKQEAAVAARGEGSTILGMNASALRAMGRNSNSHGLGGAFSGVADAVQKETAGYRDADIAYQEKINGLNQAMKDAVASNDIGKFNEYAKAKEMFEKQKAEATKTTAGVVNQDSANATSRANNADTIASNERVARIKTEALIEAASVRAEKAGADKTMKDQINASANALRSIDKNMAAAKAALEKFPDKAREAELKAQLVSLQKEYEFHQRNLAQLSGGAAYAEEAPATTGSTLPPVKILSVKPTKP